MSVFVAYSDEASAGGNAIDEFIVSGYVAREEQWPCFARAWQERALDESSDGPKLPFFHMTQIRSRAWREERGLSDDAARRRTDEALRTIHSSGFVFPSASIIIQSELEQIIQRKFTEAKKKVPAGLDEPEYFCYTAFFYIVLKDLAERFGDVEKVNFYVAKKRDRITLNLQAIARHTRAYLKEQHPRLAEILGDVYPGDPAQLLPLQAADVLCWHLQRYHADLRYHRSPEKDFRDHLMVCLKEKLERLQVWTPESLEMMAEGIDKINWDDDEATA